MRKNTYVFVCYLDAIRHGHLGLAYHDGHDGRACRGDHDDHDDRGVRDADGAVAVDGGDASPRVREKSSWGEEDPGAWGGPLGVRAPSKSFLLLWMTRLGLDVGPPPFPASPKH